MAAVTNLFRRILATFRRSRLDDELREELAQHVAWKTDSLIADGVPEREARRRARVEVGNVTRLREQSRAVWGFPSLDSVGQDVDYALRQMRRSPVTTVVAVTSLAVAIGAGSAVFALGRAALYPESGVVEPDRVFMLRWRAAGKPYPFESFDGSNSDDAAGISGTSFSSPTFRRMAAATADADLAGFADIGRVNLSLHGQAELVAAQMVSGSYFALLGVKPATGRLILPADDEGTTSSVVMSHRFWRQRLGGRADVAGSPVQINGVTFTIAGVTAPGFRGSLDVGNAPDVFVPFGAHDRVLPNADRAADPGFWWVLILARPRAGVPAEAVRSRAETVLRADVRHARPAFAESALPSVEIHPGAYGQPYTRDALREPLRLLMLAIAALLVIACTNVAGLQLARATAREREMAVRLAVGAGRSRLLRQVMTESVVLALVGGTAGVFAAQAGARLLMPALSFGANADVHPAVDWTIVACATGLSLASGILLGLAPAWRASGARTSLIAAGSLAGRGEAPRLRLGRALLVAQMALSLALVFAALLFVQSLRRLEHVDTGFQAGGLLMFRVNPLLNGYEPERVARYWTSALEEIRRIPGIAGATVTSHSLIANSSSSSEAYYKLRDGEDRKLLTLRMNVADRFFDTIGIRIVAGRSIDRRDSGSGVMAAVVNETMARQLFGQPRPVGERFRLSNRPGAPVYEVVGVAADARYNTLRGPMPAIAYLSLMQNPSTWSVTYYARAAGPIEGVAGAVREAMLRVDPAVPVFDLRGQDDQVRRHVARDRFFARLGTALGGAALLLACIGLYGLLSYAVTRRTTELGVRLALGASPGRLASSIVTESLLLAAAGTALGLPAAYALGRAAATSLFGVSATSPALLAAAAIVLLVVSASAALAPARRASRVDPLVALRAG